MACSKVRVVLVALAFLLLPPVAYAQTQNAGLGGVVRDAAGVPIAGVTVEAGSPALIERTRSVTTDGQGQYKITDLVSGTYSITFRATGFVSQRQENIELSPSVTGTVNATLSAGNQTETVVVAATSTVDTRGNTQTSVVSSDTQSKLASGTQDAQSVAKLAQGVQGAVDVGGSSGSYSAQGNSLTVRGKAGVKRLFDGLRVENMEGNGSTSYMITSTMVAQSVVETGGGNAESLAAGGTINSVPKSGSNNVKWSLQGLYTREAWQGNNIDDALKVRGISQVNTVGSIWDTSATIGGPLKKDKLWYVLSWRRWGNRNYAAGVNWNDTQGTLYYTPADGTGKDIYGVQRAAAGLPIRRGDQFEEYRSQPLRLTWQASQKNKFNFLVDYPDSGCTCRNLPGTSSPESVSHYWFGEYPKFWTWDPANHNLGYGLFQTTWSSTRTSKLLLEAGWSWMLGNWPEPYQPTVGFHDISVTDQNNANFNYNSQGVILGPDGHPNHQSDRMAERFSVSYITGSHAMKFGFQDEQGFRGAYTQVNTIAGGPSAGAPVTYRVASGIPNQITEYATPYETFSRIRHDMGLYAQDQWTIKRLTVNYGLRFSYFNAYSPAAHIDPTYFINFSRDYAEKDCIPCWKDLDPRFGAAYDLFGNGRTAVKVSMGRYVNIQVVSIANAANPIATSVTSTTRTWTTNSTSGIPNCVLSNPAAQTVGGDTCGAADVTSFGLNNPKATVYTDEVVNGSGKRGYIWDFSAEINHQLTRNLSLAGGYYRNAGYNFTSTVNRAVSSTDYSPFCVTAPVDPRLGGISGQPLCGLYSITRAANQRPQQNEVLQSADFGKQTAVNNFFGGQFSGRFARDIRVNASIDLGRTVTDNCFIVTDPSQTLFTALNTTTASYCHNVTPWTKNLQIKANGSLPLWYGVSVAPTIQNLPGQAITAVWSAPNSAILGFVPQAGTNQLNLGRNIGESCNPTGACVATFSIPLIQPGTQFEPRRTQVDLRFSKSLRLPSKLRAQINFDVYNVTNNNAVTTLNTAYSSTSSVAGGTWLKPTKVLDARLFEIGAKIDF